MNGIWWWLTEKSARGLDRDERDAVLGDAAESGATGSRAMLDVLGLVVRRQAAQWVDWRPWLALVIGLLGIRLARISFFLLAGLNRKLETYWIYKVHYASGLSGLEETELFVCQALALVVWSWIAGYVLALLSRRTLWITGSVYFSFCALFMILLCSYPLWVHTAHNGIRRNAPLLMWATLFAQAVTLAVSFVVPSVLGMRRGLRNFTFSLGQTWVLAGAVLVVTGLAAWTGGWPGAAVVRWTGNAWDPRVGLASRLYFFGLVSWPVAYLVVDSLFRRMIVKSLQAKES